MLELVCKRDWFADECLSLQTSALSLWYENHTPGLQTRRLNCKQRPVCKRVSMVYRWNWLVCNPNLSSVSNVQTELVCKQEVLVCKSGTISFSGLRTELVCKPGRPSLHRLRTCPLRNSLWLLAVPEQYLRCFRPLWHGTCSIVAPKRIVSRALRP